MSENIIQIMTADQARESLEKAIAQQYESYLPDIMYAIKVSIDTAISKFEYSCAIDKNSFSFHIPVNVIYNNMHHILEGLGYSVTYSSEFDFMLISWSVLKDE